jgi:hAT family C-terminal dimerisation region
MCRGLKKDADVTLDGMEAQVRGLGKTKIMFTEICKLLRLLLMIPVASATAERSFSALRRLKTYTRSTMTAARLTHIALLHVHQDRTDKLNDELTMQAFVYAVDLREQTFGKF